MCAFSGLDNNIYVRLGVCVCVCMSGLGVGVGVLWCERGRESKI